MAGMRGKATLITGAGSGIGRAAALELADRGVSLVVADFALDGAEETVRRATEAGGSAKAVEVDVADEVSVAAMVAAATEPFGRLDDLVNCAGITPTRRFADPVEIAKLIAFPLSDDASNMTGASVPVDGGWLAG